MKSYQQFFAELKRRHVFKVAAIYGGVAFALLQVADPLATALGLGDSFLSLVVGLLLIGFPIAMVLAWAFEVTPEGVQKSEPAAPGEIEAIVAQPAVKRWVSGLLALAGIVALVLGSVWVGRQTVSAPDLNLGVPTAEAADFVKVAVLPFEDVGGDDEGVLASGLHMDLQQQLGQLDALRLISPMSVREYRETDKSDRDIGAELGADYILRGSVRMAGNRARIDAQLIDAASSENLWQDQFDREFTLDNLWEVQSDIALRVARELATELSPEDLSALDAQAPTENLAALAAYGRARDVWKTPGAGETLADAVASARRAVELDPGFAEAWALLARILSVQAWRGEPVSEQALEAVERAELLAEGSVDAIVARAWHSYYVEQAYEEALSQLRAARQVAPSDDEVLEMTAYLHRRLGRWDEALSSMKKAVELNPRSPLLLQGYSEVLAELGRYEAADDVAERALQVGPSIPSVRANKVWTAYFRTRDARRAMGLAQELGLDVAEYGEGLMLFRMALMSGDLELAARIADELPRQGGRLREADRLWRRGWVGTLTGRDTRAIGDSLLAGDFDSTAESWGEMMQFVAHSLRGDTTRAWPLLDESIRIARSGNDVMILATQLANAVELSALFGRPELALEILEEAVLMPARDFSVANLENSPSLDSIRDDPRFQAALERRRAYEAEQARLAEAEGPWLP